LADQKEKATRKEVAKCLVCGNENIKEHHNYCARCGNHLKENPVIIDYSSQKQQV